MKKLKKTEGGMYCFLVTFDPASELLNVVDLNAPSNATQGDQLIRISDESPAPESSDSSLMRAVADKLPPKELPLEPDSEPIKEEVLMESDDVMPIAPVEILEKGLKKAPQKSKPKREYSSTDLLSRREAAEVLGVSEQTLAVWKCTGRYDLPYVKIGKLVKYRKADLDRFIDGRKHESLAPEKKER